MVEILRFLKTYEVVIYVLLGFIGMANLRKLYLALKEWQGTIYGMERDIAQRRLSEATSVLVLLVCIGLVVFGLNTFVLPSIPYMQLLATPTLNPLATPSLTLPASTQPPAMGTVQVTATLAPQAENGCVPGKVELTAPKNGASLSGKVDIKGTVKVDNYGFLKYEYAPSGSSNWATIAANHEILPPDSLLGIWDTSMLSAGDYQLRLVVEDSGKLLPPCVISVRILAASPTP
jgi:hypothetical protein